MGAGGWGAVWRKLQKIDTLNPEPGWVRFTRWTPSSVYISAAFFLRTLFLRCLLKVLSREEVRHHVGVKVEVEGKAGLALCGA